VRGLKSAPHRTTPKDGESEVKKVFGFTELENELFDVKPNLARSGALFNYKNYM
jgi:hypothetical protein